MGLDPISNVAQAASQIIQLFKTNPSIKLADNFQLQEDQLKSQVSVVLGQLEVNKVEASNINWMVAGARPAVIWICALGLLIQFLVNPIATWIAALSGHAIAFPSLDMGSLMTLLLGLLGLSGMRTYEKLQGAQGNH